MELRPSWGRAAVFFGLVGLIGSGALIPCAAWATHEMDHRFTISGYVRDKDGKPVREVKVLARDLRDQKIDPVTSYADGSGFYKLILHLHNQNAGDPIQVSVKDERSGLDEVKKIRAEFDPADRHTERQAKVDFGPETDKPGGGAGGVIGTEDASRLWLYGVGGVLVAVAIGVAVMRARHRQAAASAKRRGKKR
ncbi:MAG: carboxypeptidase regulatory-like domain-containing protein [Nitrospirae bacterium]|nr:MAG: carboxypeptidase regulatory-like domain-containing protein [Nitrospirota bacterium]